MLSPSLRALALLAIAAAPLAAAPSTPPASEATGITAAARLDTAVFAGGCFWGVQAVFQHVKGVVTATSGYAGGSVANPEYELVSTGRTGHAEAVRVVFDPAKVSYETLLDVFFTVAHDPTELNRQGPDVGSQYRSAIWATSSAQIDAATKMVSALEKSGRYKRPIVTQIAALKGFYPAEAYHQDYATLHPDAPYIVYNDAPKIEALRRQYASLWNDRIAGH
jgi:peptide-methionine (S)-S-oxide reductase